MERRQGALEDVDMMMDSLFKGFFNGKTVLVTGHTGFKGSWLSLWLLSLGARVVGYSLPPPTEPSIFEAARLEEHLVHITGDVRDYVTVERIMLEYRPELVFHLAAQPLVRLSYLEPRVTYEANVMGTVNVLEAVRRTDSVCACVVVTSDKCYENKEWAYPYRENDILGGHDPYSSSKACVEMVVSTYRNSFFSNGGGQYRAAISSARAGNVIGGGDWAFERILPDAIRALAGEQPVPVRNPHAIRPWQHVLESLSGYLWLAAMMENNPAKYSSAWNFGPDCSKSITVSQLVGMIIGRWGQGSWQESFNERKGEMTEAGILKLDCTKAACLLHWLPNFSVIEAVESAVDWYKHYYLNNGAGTLTYTVRQIEAYVDKARQAGAVWA